MSSSHTQTAAGNGSSVFCILYTCTQDLHRKGQSRPWTTHLSCASPRFAPGVHCNHSSSAPLYASVSVSLCKQQHGNVNCQIHDCKVMLGITGGDFLLNQRGYHINTVSTWMQFVCSSIYWYMHICDHACILMWMHKHMSTFLSDPTAHVFVRPGKA